MHFYIFMFTKLNAEMKAQQDGGWLLRNQHLLVVTREEFSQQQNSVYTEMSHCKLKPHYRHSHGFL
jgi:hypothetical protein